MKNYLYSMLLAMIMVMGTAMSSFADITIKVNMADVVTFHFSGARGSVMLDEGDNVFTAEECNGELRVIRVEYNIECRNLTTGENLKVDQYQEFSKVNVNNYLVNDGDVLEVTVTDVTDVEPTVRVIFDNSKAGYVAYLTNYDISGGSCFGDDFPLDSNEDKYFYPDDDGMAYVPYDYNRRIRIRTNEGFSLLSARNPKETNPHYDGYRPNSRGVIEMGLVELNVNDVVEVKTAEHGVFTVKGVGNYLNEIEMVDNTNYERLEVKSEPLSIEFTGQTYTIRIRSLETVNHARSVIEKIVVTNNAVTHELVVNDNGHLYIYTPAKGDEVTIYLDDVTEAEGIEAIGASSTSLYRIDGTRINRSAGVPAGMYIEKGKKLIIK